MPIFIQNVLKFRVGTTLSTEYLQEEMIPQSEVISLLFFILMINDIIKQPPPFIKGILLVDDFQISCAWANMNIIERHMSQ